MAVPPPPSSQDNLQFHESRVLDNDLQEEKAELISSRRTVGLGFSHTKA